MTREQQQGDLTGARTLHGGLEAMLDRIEASVTLYDLFAIAVLYMIFGHFGESFADKLWLRTGDRILVPVFLISIGYNVGRKVDWRLLAGAAIVAFLRWFMYHHWLPALSSFPANVLVTIIAIRFFIDPLMHFALASKWRFWSVTIAMMAFAHLTNEHVALYGTLGVLLAMAGWLARSRNDIPKGIVNVEAYFIFVFCFYIAFNEWRFGFSALQLSCIVAGTALVFRLLYDMRKILSHSLRRKPDDLITKICRFVGRNSLEIYTLHMIVYYGIFYYAFSVHV